MKAARAPLVAVFGFFLIAAFAWWSSVLGIEFYGDDVQFVANVLVKGRPTLFDYLVFTKDRPLNYGLLWGNALFAGETPAGYRALTLVLHAAVATALFRVLAALARRHLGRPGLGVCLGVSALALVHPVHSEALQIVVQRGVVLSALFSLVSIERFLRFVDTRSRRALASSTAAQGLALLSKSNSLATPFILLLYVAIFERRRLWKNGRPGDVLRALLPNVALALAPVLAYGALGLRTQHASLPVPSYLALQQKVLWIYARLFVWPVRLRYLYALPPPFDAWTLVALAGHLAVVAVAVLVVLKSRKRSPKGQDPAKLAAFGVLAAYLALAPESSVFPIRYPIWEYRTYFPFCFAWVALLPLAFAAVERARNLSALGAACVCAASFAAIRERAAEVSTSDRFVANTVSYQPRDLVFNTDLLALALAGAGGYGGDETVALVRRSNPGVREIELFGQALDLRTHRDPAGIKALADAITRSPGVGPFSRAALDAFVVSEIKATFSGDERATALFNLLVPQLLLLEPGAAVSPRLGAMLGEARSVLELKRARYAELSRVHRLSVGDEARQIWTDAFLEVYFARPGGDLAARFEGFLAAHPEGGKTREFYDWYRKTRKAQGSGTGQGS